MSEQRDLIEVMDFTLGLYLVVTNAAEIVYASAGMRERLELECGLCERGGRLTTAEPDQALALRRWIADVSSTCGGSSPILAIDRSDDPPLILRAHAVPAAEPREGRREPPLAIISVHDVLASRSLADLSRLFELTCAERLLCEHILSGASMSDALAALGITSNTGRTHLKSIYRKTGARNQADLVRLLKDVASISAPSTSPAPEATWPTPGRYAAGARG